jgi:hypothetical protein
VALKVASNPVRAAAVALLEAGAAPHDMLTDVFNGVSISPVSSTASLGHTPRHGRYGALLGTPSEHCPRENKTSPAGKGVGLTSQACTEGRLQPSTHVRATHAAVEAPFLSGWPLGASSRVRSKWLAAERLDGTDLAPGRPTTSLAGGVPRGQDVPRSMMGRAAVAVRHWQRVEAEPRSCPPDWHGTRP